MGNVVEVPLVRDEGDVSAGSGDVRTVSLATEVVVSATTVVHGQVIDAGRNCDGTISRKELGSKNKSVMSSTGG